MARYVLRTTTRVRDLVAAMIYGAILTVVLGMPSFDLLKEKENVDPVPTKMEDRFIDGQTWQSWKMTGLGTILCPPGQAAFVVEYNLGEPQLVCGYTAVKTSKRCANAKEKNFSCLASADVLAFYSSIGYETPSNFNSCCPGESKAICRYTSNNSRIRGILSCENI